MRNRPFPAWLLLSLLAWPAGAIAQPTTDAQDPSILPRPFTAAQIRAAWVPGLTLELQRTTPEGQTLERWTVMASDTDGAYIEYATLDGDGEVAGEPRLERSSWVELRDHASFKADRSRRESATRETALGTLDGWLYTVDDPETGTASEFFFARSYPGAPVQVRVTRSGELVMELLQLARRQPE